VEKVVEIALSKDEKAAFDKSVDAVKGLTQAIKL
jgi:malate/lactate dehydrogenase